MQIAKEAQQENVDRYADCTRLNEYDLLMAAFLREADSAADSLRFQGQRELVAESVGQISDHMLGFQPLLRNNKPDEQWSFHGPGGSYGFILVSKPKHLRSDYDAYVERARRFISTGVERIYILGRSEERAFVDKVVGEVLSLRELKGIELFPLYRDYRGAPGGICALVGTDKILMGLKLSTRPLKGMATEDRQPEPERAAAYPDEDLPASETVAPELHDKELGEIVDDMMVRLSDYEGEWIALTEFGGELRKRVPAFTPRTYGERNLVSVLGRLPQLELDERGIGQNRVFYVRVLPGYSSALVEKSRPLKEAGVKVAALVSRYATSEWVYLSAVGQLIRRYYPEFELEDFGVTSLHEFIEAVGLFEIDERGEGYSKTYVKVSVD